MSKLNADAFLSHVKQKWSGRSCPMCLSGPWEIQDSVFELREFAGGSVVVGAGPILPVIPVICANCGNTILVNALIGKAIERPAEAKK